MSDGTDELRFLDPATFKEQRRLKVTAVGTAVPRLNELEYVKGEVLANVWQTDYVARIDPKTGRIGAWIDLRGLLTPRERAATDVLNGIAYDAEHDRLFVTGKLWPKTLRDQAAADALSAATKTQGVLENARRGNRPPAQLHLPDDVLLRHHAPVAAVGAVVPMVAHDEVVALRNDLRAPVVVAAVVLGNVVVVQRDVVHVHTPVDDADRIVLLRDHPLDEGLVGIERVVEHDDVAAARLADAIHQLVDDEPVLIFERRRHAAALDACDLESEGDDQDGVDGRRQQRPDPGHEFVTHLAKIDLDWPVARGRRPRTAGGRRVGGQFRDAYSFR